MLDWSLTNEYDEMAVSGGLGPGGMVGFETSGGETAPALTVGIFQVQPGQVMVGVANPLGPGGARVGVEFRLPQKVFIVTSRATFETAGGPIPFGLRFVHEDANYKMSVTYTGGGGISGFDRAVGATRWSLPVWVVP